MAAGRGLMWLQSPLKFFTFLLLMAPVLFLNWDGSSMNQLLADSTGVQYALPGFKPSSIKTTKRANIRGKYHLPSRFPYATDNICNFQLARRIILSGDVEANLGPKKANVHQESKQINVQCQSKSNGGLKISLNR